MKSKNLSFFSDGIAAGILLCIGGAANLSSQIPLAGAFLFSLGLFAIITFKFGLYTGKAGYMATKPPSYIIEVVLTLVGNAVGCAFAGLLLNLTPLALNSNASICEKAAALITTKTAAPLISAAVSGIFCGILMFTAVDGNRRASANGNFVGALFITVMPVMAFIVCGFNHSIADMAYFFIGKCAHAASFLPYIAAVILGNAVGCMLLPLLKKLSVNK